MTDYCIPLASCSADRRAAVGGKNASLGALVDAGVRVPAGFAITTAAYTDFLRHNGIETVIDERLSALADGASVAEVGEDIRAAIDEGTFDAAGREAIRESWESLAERADGTDRRVAVRSSATAEDRPGQHDTYLDVGDFEALLDRTRACMASLYTDRAITYREENGVDQRDVALSVGVQRLVDADKSGVLFTLNTANGDRSKVQIEATWGLGEAIVSGRVTPDYYLVDKPSLTVVDRSISTKTEKVVSRNGETGVVQVPEDRRESPSLSEAEIEHLASVGKRLERHFGTPQDVEWAIDTSQDVPESVFVLQSRPETTWD
jgi:pyruvate,water dikinase